jgi:hypothetical protein
MSSISILNRKKSEKKKKDFFERGSVDRTSSLVSYAIMECVF